MASKVRKEYVLFVEDWGQTYLTEDRRRFLLHPTSQEVGRHLGIQVDYAERSVMDALIDKGRGRNGGDGKYTAVLVPEGMRGTQVDGARVIGYGTEAGKEDFDNGYIVLEPDVEQFASRLRALLTEW